MNNLIEWTLNSLISFCRLFKNEKVKNTISSTNRIIIYIIYGLIALSLFWNNGNHQAIMYSDRDGMNFWWYFMSSFIPFLIFAITSDHYHRKYEINYKVWISLCVLFCITATILIFISNCNGIYRIESLIENEYLYREDEYPKLFTDIIFYIGLYLYANIIFLPYLYPVIGYEKE